MKIFSNLYKLVIVLLTAELIFARRGVDFCTSGALSVYDSFSGANGKSVVFKKMLFHLGNKPTFNVDKLPTAYTFQVKRLVTFRPLGILIASTASLIDYEFFDNSLLTEPIKCTINSSCANRNALSL